MTAEEMVYNRLKLDMLASIASSQQAVARMMHAAADTAGAVQLPAELIGEHLRALAAYQSAVLAQLSGISLRFPRRGNPATPWLNAGVTPPVFGPAV